MRDIVLISDPRVASIPVEESGEQLIDVRGRLRTDGRPADPEGAFAHLRFGRLDRLEKAQAQLPGDTGCWSVEGYRPPAAQKKIFDEYSAELRATFPEMSPAELRAAASRYVSPVEIAPHTAGAAVDLTLSTEDGTELDMGTPLNATPEQSGGACYTDASGLSAEARHHREILGAALETAGLVNYPTEWWHWSYGDRYWAMTTGAPAALYGPLSLSDDPSLLAAGTWKTAGRRIFQAVQRRGKRERDGAVTSVPILRRAGRPANLAGAAPGESGGSRPTPGRRPAGSR